MERFEPIIIDEPKMGGMFWGPALHLNTGISYDTHDENSTVITNAGCTRGELLTILRQLGYPIRESI